MNKLSKLIKRLEKYKAQMPQYESLISKILIRNKKDVEFILRNLLIYLKENKDIKVLDINELDPKERKLKYLLVIRFKCSVCGNIVTEQTNLNQEMRFPRFHQPLICQRCLEKMKQDAS